MSAAAVSILDALDDEALFAPHFKGDSWAAWRAFLAALFALAMSDDLAAIYRACTGRVALPMVAFVEACLIVGRRGGKSRTLALIADRRVSGNVPRLCAISRAGRAWDGRSHSGESRASALDHALHFRPVAQRPVARAADRG